MGEKLRRLIKWEVTSVLVAATLVATYLLFAPTGFAENLGSTEFMPHGHCYFWRPDILWLHVVSDSLVAISYFAIPVCLVYFVRKRQGLKFRGVFWLFSLFILFCGVTHALEVYSVWHGAYYLTGSVKLLTGLVSAATAIYLANALPVLLKIPLPDEFQAVEHRLTDRESKFETILKGGVDGFVMLRPVQGEGGSARGFVIEECNEIASDEMGVTRRDAVGKRVEDLLSFGGAVDVSAELASVFAAQEPKEREVEFATSDGGARWISYKIVPAGGILAMFFADVTRSRSAERSLQKALEERANKALLESDAQAARAKAALEAAAHGVLITDSDGRIVQTNRQLLTLFGFAEEELTGQPFEMLVAESSRGDFAVLKEGVLAVSRENRSYPQSQLQGQRKDGSRFPVEVNLNRFETPEGVFIIASFLDQTKRLEASRALEAKNREIEQIMYAVSHDLKTPLVSIQGLTAYLKDSESVEGEVPKELLGRIEGSAKHMGNMISDLLEMSRVGRASETIEVVDTQQIYDETRVILDHASRSTGCEWKTRGRLPTLRINRNRMSQLLQNLASNAVQYGRSPEGPNVLEVGSTRAETHVDIFVEDHGPGIPPEYHKSVFKLFKRIDRTQEGTGIGLAIVSKIMETYGGSALLESEVGKGSKFILRFPIAMLVEDEGAAGS